MAGVLPPCTSLDDDGREAVPQEGKICEKARHAPVAVEEGVDGHEGDMRLCVAQQRLGTIFGRQGGEFSDPPFHELRSLLEGRILVPDELSVILNMGSVVLPLPCSDGAVHVGDRGRLDETVQLEKFPLAEGCVSHGHFRHAFDCIGMAFDVEMLLQRLAGHRQPFPKEEQGVPFREPSLFARGW